jgi:two-component system chemotaxis sensor kinase CheA
MLIAAQYAAAPGPKGAHQPPRRRASALLKSNGPLPNLGEDLTTMAKDEPTLQSLLEELALAASLASADDDSVLTEIGALLRAVEAELAARGTDAQRALRLECAALLTHLAAAPSGEKPALLAALGAAVERMRAAPTGPVVHVPAPAPAPAPAPMEAVRDAETIELINDFLTEADDSLSKADEILMAVENEGLTSDDVNGLFRIFHTIKGVAGFLDFHDIVALAHTTETLLDRVRQGLVTLVGARLDRVFDATGTMRRLLAVARAAVETGTEVASVDIRALLAAFAAVLEAGPEPAAAPRAAPAPPETTAPAETGARASAPPAAVPADGDAAGEGDGDGDAEPRDASEAGARRGAAETGGTRAPGTKLRETLKVDVDRVDNFVEMVGELIIVQSMVVHSPEIATLQSLRIQGCLNQLSKISRDLQDVAMRMRMVPVRGVFRKLARMVRELSRKMGKDVVLATAGEGTEMDRSMVERLEEPLVHMIRNSMDHGIEDAAGRQRAGKPTTATIKLSAYHTGGSVIIEVTDDGRGLSRDAILKKARDQGILREGDSLADSDVWDLIFAPGFSTAAKITEISGRGVGMDVVKRTVETMRGRVHIAATSNQGTLFRIILPLTLAIIDGMLIACGNEVYILPSLSILESLQPKASMLFALGERRELVSVRGELLPLMRLSRVFGVEGAEEDPTKALVVVVENLGRKVALLVDDVIDEQQVVIKSLDAGIAGAEHFSGAAILPNGRVGLILNVDRIGAMAGSDTRAPARPRPVAEAAT